MVSSDETPLSRAFINQAQFGFFAFEICYIPRGGLTANRIFSCGFFYDLAVH